MPRTRARAGKKRKSLHGETPKKKSEKEPTTSTSEEEEQIVTKKRKPVKKSPAKKKAKKPKPEASDAEEPVVEQKPKKKSKSVARTRKIPTRKRKAEEPAGVASEEGILRAFDMDITFGGCMGISRLDRWKRAKRFNLDPPDAVKKILEKYEETDVVNKCLWEEQV